ncbi:hypothetical protein ES708_31060 [subsurface metagenome]
MKLNYGIIRIMKDKEITKSKIIKEPTQGKEERKKIGHRPTLLTPELRARLIRLFEEHFFLWIVAAEVDIYKEQICEWKREQKDFHNAVTHAQGKWIRQQMKLLDEYAKDKREKDWRALKYKLSIADAEFSDKKYLKEAPGKKDSTQITIIINRRDLETAEEEVTKIIGEGKTEEETISLIPFQEEKRKKPAKSERKANPGEAETL